MTHDSNLISGRFYLTLHECGGRVVAVVHAPVPVGQHVPRELGGEPHHAEPEVGAVVKVELNKLVRNNKVVTIEPNL